MAKTVEVRTVPQKLVAGGLPDIDRSPKALRHLIAKGDIPAVREGNRIHLDRADLDQWIELRKTRN